jgi:hypothetical protein
LAIKSDAQYIDRAFDVVPALNCVPFTFRPVKLV